MDLARILNYLLSFYGYSNQQYIGWFLVAAGVIYIALLVMGGFGLYKLAARQGLKHKWRAFVPFANVYLMGQLAGDNCTLFGTKIKRIKIWLTVVEVLAAVLGILYATCYALKYTPFFPEDGDVITKAAKLYTYYGREFIDYEFYTENMNGLQLAVYRFRAYGKYAYYVAEILYYVFFVTAIVSLFRRYAPAQSMIFSLICVFLPVENIFIFAMRNNKEVNYRDYMNARYARYRRQYYAPPRDPYRGGPQGGGYNYDPYTGRPVNHNGGSNSSSSSADENPFPEFGGNDGGSSGSSSGSSSGDGNNSQNPFDM